MSKKLRDFARGQECALRLFPYCNWDPATTVLAHLPHFDHGMAKKGPDEWAVHACHACHDLIDGRRKVSDISPLELERAKLRALSITQARLKEAGLMTLK